MFALGHERQSHLNSVLKARNTQTSQLSMHPFIACNLGVRENAPMDRGGSSQTRKPSAVLRQLISGTDQLLPLALSKEDEKCYVDFKARAFAVSAEGSGECVQSVSRLWAGRGSLFSGIWNPLLDSVENAPQKSGVANQPSKLMSGLQQVRVSLSCHLVLWLFSPLRSF